VTVEPFLIDTWEVTNLQWWRYLQSTGREPSEHLAEFGWPLGVIPQGAEHLPISNVSLEEVRDFLDWCGKRLPTEVEWTRAARGDDQRTYPWGDHWRSDHVVSGHTPPQTPQDVGTHPEGASPFGVQDMAGNVFEWVDAAFKAYDGFQPIRQSTAGGPQGRLLTPPFRSDHQVVKGGCFISDRHHLRIDSRFGVDPGESDTGLGFRAARSPGVGVDAVVSAYEQLLPARFPTRHGLDLQDVFGAEVYTYENSGSRSIITDYSYLVFAHPTPSRGPGLSRLRRQSPDEPVTLGLLATSEALEFPELPAGAYVVAYRAAGSQRRERQATGASEPDEAAETPVPDRLTDVPYPHDQDLLLFYNGNDAVVGWVPCPEVSESVHQSVSARASADGRLWRIGFSLDTMNRRTPRFTLPLKLRSGIRLTGR
jgi:hypothetical protein